MVCKCLVEKWSRILNGGLKTKQKMSVKWANVSGIWIGRQSYDQTIWKLDKKVSEKSNDQISGVCIQMATVIENKC